MSSLLPHSFAEVPESGMQEDDRGHREQDPVAKPPYRRGAFCNYSPEDKALQAIPHFMSQETKWPRGGIGECRTFWRHQGI